MIMTSDLLQHKQIATFSSFRSEVFREFSQPSKIKGVQSKTMPTLNKLLKGHRKYVVSLPISFTELNLYIICIWIVFAVVCMLGY